MQIGVLLKFPLLSEVSIVVIRQPKSKDSWTNYFLNIHDKAMYLLPDGVCCESIWIKYLQVNECKWTISQEYVNISSSLFYVFLCWPGLSHEKTSSFVKRFRSEPRYLLAQNVSTCIDPLEVCLHRQTVQDTVHIFQHSIPTEGKPVTNQKNSGTHPAGNTIILPQRI